MQTKNHVEIGLGQVRVAELYTCRESLPKWFPALVSFEVLDDGTSGQSFRAIQTYTVMGKRIEEEILLLEEDLPHCFSTISTHGEHLKRKSTISFKRLDETRTKLTVRNEFSGQIVDQLVKHQLHSYTQETIERFRDFAERHSL